MSMGCQAEQSENVVVTRDYFVKRTKTLDVKSALGRIIIRNQRTRHGNFLICKVKNTGGGLRLQRKII